MKKNLLFLRVTLIAIAIGVVFILIGYAKSNPQGKAKEPNLSVDEKSELIVVWTSGDKEVALKMVFMYTYNAKKYEWWKDITLVIWGPSAKLASEDAEIQEYLGKMQDEGIILRACKGCADQYAVSTKLEELGIEVVYIGKDFTDYLKDESSTVVTF